MPKQLIILDYLQNLLEVIKRRREQHKAHESLVNKQKAGLEEFFYTHKILSCRRFDQGIPQVATSIGSFLIPLSL